MDLESKLLGGDLRSISKSEEIVEFVKNQQQFDDLFNFIDNSNRLLQMRSIDAIEKITLKYPEFLNSHKNKIIELSSKQQNIEFKWHLALLLPRLELNINEINTVYTILYKWALDVKESKIVRVNSIQALHELSNLYNFKREEFIEILSKIQKENIPSLNAKIKHLSN